MEKKVLQTPELEMKTHLFEKNKTKKKTPVSLLPLFLSYICSFPYKDNVLTI